MNAAGQGLKSALHPEALIGGNEPGCQNVHRQIGRALFRADELGRR